MEDFKISKNKLLEISFTSPALIKKANGISKFAYPKEWNNKVPLKVKMLKTVKSDLPFISALEITAYKDEHYYVWVNSHGAVAAILRDGEQLGLKPNEFEVIEFHK